MATQLSYIFWSNLKSTMAVLLRNEFESDGHHNSFQRIPHNHHANSQLLLGAIQLDPRDTSLSLHRSLDKTRARGLLEATLELPTAQQHQPLCIYVRHLTSSICSWQWNASPEYLLLMPYLALPFSTAGDCYIHFLHNIVKDLCWANWFSWVKKHAMTNWTSSQWTWGLSCIRHHLRCFGWVMIV